MRDLLVQPHLHPQPRGRNGSVLGERRIRSDLRENQPGVPVIIDGQFINVETCEPIPNLYWDVWNCNTTAHVQPHCNLVYTRAFEVASHVLKY